jgi:amidase
MNCLIPMLLAGIEFADLISSGTGFDCSKYVGSPLCVQVVAPRLEERRLVEIMGVIDEAVHRETERLSAKL